MFKNRSFLIVFLTVFIDMLGFGLVVPVLPVYTKELGASDTVVGIIAAIFSLMNFLFTPFLGSLSDRIGRRPIILISIVANIIGYVILASTQSIWGLAISRLICGIGSANIAAAQAYVADISTPENRAKAMGMIGAAFGLGFVFGPAMGGLLKGQFGSYAVGLAAAVFCVINFVWAYFFLPEANKEKNPNAPIRCIPFRDIFNAFQRSIIRELLSMWLIYVAAFSMMQTVMALLLKEDYGRNDIEVGIFFAIVGITSAVIQGGLVGKMVKMYGERNLLIIGSVLMFFGFALIPVMPSFNWWYATFVITLISLGNACLTPSLTASISTISDPHEQGRMLGISQSVGSLGRVMGPLLSGALYHVKHPMPFFTSAGLMVICLFLARIIRVELKQRAAQKAVLQS
jgi:MFS transporter, DHA1 family, tetracycline resistance protein